jgi:uncharacterized protein
MKPNHISIYGRAISHIGSLDNKKILLIIGRSNFIKGSIPLQSISHLLSRSNYTLLWYGQEIYPKTQYLRKIIRALVPNKYLLSLIRNFISIILFLKHPSQWNYIWSNKHFLLQGSWLNSLYQNFNETQKLHHFIQCFDKEKEITILSHSSGGRISSSIANELEIKKLICFGYPFKHPNEDEDLTRTMHLKNLKTPFLIIQGTKDEYGGIDAKTQYELSSSITLFYLKTNHDFTNVTDNDWLQIATLINTFLLLPEHIT